MMASEWGKLEVVRTLLENRANVETQNMVSDDHDRGNSNTYYCRYR